MLLQVELYPLQAPDHEYVYEPVPPEALLINVTDCPEVTELGEA